MTRHRFDTGTVLAALALTALLVLGACGPVRCTDGPVTVAAKQTLAVLAVAASGLHGGTGHVGGVHAGTGQGPTYAQHRLGMTIAAGADRPPHCGD